MREAAIGMGATPTQVVTKVILPTAFPGILTGVMLALARAAGETAPLLFTSLFSEFWMSRTHPYFLPKTMGDLMKPTASLAVLIYNFSGLAVRKPDRDGVDGGADPGRHGPRAQLRRSVDIQTLCTIIKEDKSKCAAAIVKTNGDNHTQGDTLIDCNISGTHYGKFKAVRDVAVKIGRGTITAFIGPSGCGKSTALRCLNRMNDLVRGFRLKGNVIFRGQDIYADKIDPVAVRRHIGMVFQQPNPFAMSIFRNVAFGLRLNGYKGEMEKGGAGAALRLRCGTRSRTS